jgi:hypothetical protein
MEHLMPTLHSHTHCHATQPTLQPKLGKECVCPTAPQTDQRVTEKNNEGITACMKNGGFSAKFNSSSSIEDLC